jgi:hypothetical protein
MRAQEKRVSHFE